MRWEVVIAFLLVSGCLSASTSEDVGAMDTRLVHVFDGEYRTSDAYSLVLEAGPYRALDYELIELKSDLDGAAMQIGLVRPDVDTPVPIVVHASPYYDTLAVDATMEERHYWVNSLVENLVPHGFAVALVALRGSADNGGCLDLWGGPLESADLAQGLEHLAAQPWSTGKIGMIGMSYPGFAAFTAASISPHVRTIVPIEATPDPFSVVVHNGTPVPFFALAPAIAGPTIWGTSVGTRAPLNIATGSICRETVDPLASAGPTMAVRERTAYWAERDHRPGLGAYQGSIFSIHSLRDPAVWPSSGLILPRDKLMLGQWGHHFPDSTGRAVYKEGRVDFAEIILRWFQHELMEDASIDVGPAVQVQDSAGSWRSSDTWPPVDARTLSLHMTPGGGLSATPVPAIARVTIQGPDALLQYAGACPSCVRFVSDPQPSELRFAGTPILRATIEPLGMPAFLTAELFVVESGKWTLLTGAQVDSRFASGSEKGRVHGPRESVELALGFQPTDAVIPAGASLGLVLSQRTYFHAGAPADMRSVALGTSAWGDVASAPIDIVIGKTSGILDLQTFEVPPTAFFEAPTTS